MAVFGSCLVRYGNDKIMKRQAGKNILSAELFNRCNEIANRDIVIGVTENGRENQELPDVRQVVCR